MGCAFKSANSARSSSAMIRKLCCWLKPAGSGWPRCIRKGTCWSWCSERTAHTGVDGFGTGHQKSSPACKGEGGGLYLGRDGGVRGGSVRARDSLLVTLSWHPIRLRPFWTRDAVRKPCEGAMGEDISRQRQKAVCPGAVGNAPRAAGITKKQDRLNDQKIIKKETERDRAGVGLGRVGSRPHPDLQDRGRHPSLRVTTGPVGARLSGCKACRTDDRPCTPPWHTREGDAAVPVCMGRSSCLCM